MKGLEFDTVIVFEPSAREYPANTDGRRALYMVVTRAKERLRLHFVGCEPTSELLSVAMDR